MMQEAEGITAGKNDLVRKEGMGSREKMEELTLD